MILSNFRCLIKDLILKINGKSYIYIDLLYYKGNLKTNNNSPIIYCSIFTGKSSFVTTQRHSNLRITFLHVLFGHFKV